MRRDTTYKLGKRGFIHRVCQLFVRLLPELEMTGPGQERAQLNVLFALSNLYMVRGELRP